MREHTAQLRRVLKDFVQNGVLVQGPPIFNQEPLRIFYNWMHSSNKVNAKPIDSLRRWGLDLWNEFKLLHDHIVRTMDKSMTIVLSFRLGEAAPP